MAFKPKPKKRFGAVALLGLGVAVLQYVVFR
jgi:hypothetical protein